VQVVIPYVDGMLNEGVLPAVRASGLPWVAYPLERGDLGAYGRLWRRLWALRETVIVCEHDVIPTVAQLLALTMCGHDWCSYNYDDGMYPAGPMFGLARFSGTMMAEHPYAAEVALVIGKRRDIECEWWRVDSMVARDLMIRRVSWNMHEPAVHHAHVGAPSGPL
jgi:hypothetical protein